MLHGHLLLEKIILRQQLMTLICILPLLSHPKQRFKILEGVLNGTKEWREKHSNSTKWVQIILRKAMKHPWNKWKYFAFSHFYPPEQMDGARKWKPWKLVMKTLLKIKHTSWPDYNIFPIHGTERQNRPFFYYPLHGWPDTQHLQNTFFSVWSQLTPMAEHYDSIMAGSSVEFLRWVDTVW